MVPDLRWDAAPSPSESDDDAPVGMIQTYGSHFKQKKIDLLCRRSSAQPKTKDQTFDVNLSRRVVGPQAVGGYAGVASRVVLEGFADHQRVQDTITGDLDVGRVVQLSAFAEPPRRRGSFGTLADRCHSKYPPNICSFIHEYNRGSERQRG